MERARRAVPGAIVAAVAVAMGAVAWHDGGASSGGNRPSAADGVRIVVATDGDAESATMPVAPVGDRAAAMPVIRRDMRLIAALTPRGSDDLRMLADAIAHQPTDAPVDRLAEQKAGALLERHLRLATGGGDVRVACTVVTCEATGTLAGAGQSLDATPLLEAMVEAGFSPGPFAQARGAGGTEFLLYLNREG